MATFDIHGRLKTVCDVADNLGPNAIGQVEDIIEESSLSVEDRVAQLEERLDLLVRYLLAQGIAVPEELTTNL